MIDSSRFILDVESLDILFVETSSSFLLSKIALDEIFFSSYSLLDEVYPLDVESFEDHSTIEIVILKKIIGVAFSSCCCSTYKSFLMNLLDILLYLSSLLHFLTIELTY